MTWGHPMVSQGAGRLRAAEQGRGKEGEERPTGPARQVRQGANGWQKSVSGADGASGSGEVAHMGSVSSAMQGRFPLALIPCLCLWNLLGKASRTASVVVHGWQSDTVDKLLQAALVPKLHCVVIWSNLLMDSTPRSSVDRLRVFRALKMSPERQEKSASLSGNSTLGKTGILHNSAVSGRVTS